MPHPESPQLYSPQLYSPIVAQPFRRRCKIGSWVWVVGPTRTIGTYALSSVTPSSIAGQRLTGDGRYTDKFDFSFALMGTGGCAVASSSESQVASVIDFSTNYCNLRNLYCSSKEGCPGASRPVVRRVLRTMRPARRYEARGRCGAEISDLGQNVANRWCISQGGKKRATCCIARTPSPNRQSL